MEGLEDLPDYETRVAQMMDCLGLYRAAERNSDVHSAILDVMRNFESSLACFCERHRPPQIGLYSLHALAEVLNGNISDENLDKMTNIEGFRSFFIILIEHIFVGLKSAFPQYRSVFDEALTGLAFADREAFTVDLPTFAGLMVHEESESVENCPDCNSDARKDDAIARLREQLVSMCVAMGIADDN